MTMGFGFRGVRGAALAILMVALATACTPSQPRSSNPSTGAAQGPLLGVPPHGWSARVGAGTGFTDGFEVIIRPDNESVIIQAISLDADPELELLGAALLPPGRELGSVQFVDSWPPTTDPELDSTRSMPLPAQIDSVPGEKQGWELLIGMRANESGRFLRRGFWIDYTLDGRDYRDYWPAMLAICAGGRDREPCSPPEY